MSMFICQDGRNNTNRSKHSQSVVIIYKASVTRLIASLQAVRNY